MSPSPPTSPGPEAPGLPSSQPAAAPNTTFLLASGSSFNVSAGGPAAFNHSDSGGFNHSSKGFNHSGNGINGTSGFNASAFNSSDYTTGTPSRPGPPSGSSEDFTFEPAPALTAAQTGGVHSANLSYAFAGVGRAPVPPELRPAIVEAPEDIRPRRASRDGNDSRSDGGGVRGRGGHNNSSSSRTKSTNRGVSAAGSHGSGSGNNGSGSTRSGGAGYCNTSDDRGAMDSNSHGSSHPRRASPSPGPSSGHRHRRLLQANDPTTDPTTAIAPARPAAAGAGAGAPRAPQLTTSMSTSAAARPATALPPLPSYLSPNFTGLAPAFDTASLNASNFAPVGAGLDVLNTSSADLPFLRPPVPTGNPVRPGDLPQDIATAAAVAAGGSGPEGTTPDPVPAPVQSTASDLIVATPDVRRPRGVGFGPMEVRVLHLHDPVRLAFEGVDGLWSVLCKLGIS